MVKTGTHATQLAENIIDRNRDVLGVSWPKGMCYSTCLLIINDIREAYPQAMIMGGQFNDRGIHVWIELNDGINTILDPTASQFLGGRPVQAFTPDNPEYEYYYPDGTSKEKLDIKCGGKKWQTTNQPQSINTRDFWKNQGSADYASVG